MSPLLNNIKTNLATVGSMLLITLTGAFWVGTVTAELRSDVDVIKEEQRAQKDTNVKLMNVITTMSVNIERIAIAVGVSTK